MEFGRYRHVIELHICEFRGDRVADLAYKELELQGKKSAFPTFSRARRQGPAEVLGKLNFVA